MTNKYGVKYSNGKFEKVYLTMLIVFLQVLYGVSDVARDERREGERYEAISTSKTAESSKKHNHQCQPVSYTPV